MLMVIFFSPPWSVIRNEKNNQKISNRPLKENENSASKTTETLREIRFTIVSFHSLKEEDGQAWQHPSWLPQL